MYTVILLWHVSGCGPLSLNQINKNIFTSTDQAKQLLLAATEPAKLFSSEKS